MKEHSMYCRGCLLEEDLKTVREALEAHHAYHFRKKGPQEHDDEACEVDEALSALLRIEEEELG